MRRYKKIPIIPNYKDNQNGIVSGFLHMEFLIPESRYRAEVMKEIVLCALFPLDEIGYT
ncbi:hypothetical protein D3C76_1843040 [compost metagenome]